MKKKVLFLINNLADGGAEKVLVNLLNNMNKEKYDVTLRLLVNEGHNIDDLSSDIKLEYIFDKAFKGMNYLYLLPSNYIYKKIVRGNYDLVIVYLHGVLTKIVSYAPKNQKTIAYLHANMEKSPFMKSFRNKKQMRKCFSTYDRLVAVSENVKESFIKMYGNIDNICVKYNTFDVRGIVEASMEGVQESLFDKNVFNICAVGKLEEVKGFSRLIKTIYKLKAEGILIKLIIVGEGNQRNGLEALIEELNLEEDVHLCGFEKNPYKYINKCDLFVCSSYSEGFSSVVAESIILEQAVLTTDCAGMREILGEHNEYGIIVENSDNGLYSGIKKIYYNPRLLEHYRKQAKIRREWFLPKQTVKEVEKMIDEVTK